MNIYVMFGGRDLSANRFSLLFQRSVVLSFQTVMGSASLDEYG